MNNVSNLIEKIRNGKVIFFTGAGISFDSSLFTPNDVMRKTCEGVVPGFCTREYQTDKERASVKWIDQIMTIQPELFYSVLINCAGDNKVLDIWRCLREREWNEYNNTAKIPFQPKPNTNHYFLVDYAHTFHLPIFTVNYDTMLEEAARERGYDMVVLTHQDEPRESIDKVCICKLHGTIGDANEIRPTDICTTLESIATYIEQWKHIENTDG